MKSPFQYGTLVDHEFFVNRVAERKQLKNLLSSGINVMLISPRRWGKSSLVKVAMNELVAENQDIRVCYMDAFSIKSEAEFYQTFAKEVIRSTASTAERFLDDVKTFLRGVSPSITLRTDSTESMSFDLKFALGEKDKMDVLDLPQRIARQKRIRLIVCIDEFQQLATLPAYSDMEGKMRSVWQQQDDVTYCFYGSKRHMMMDIFNNASHPFYRFGQVLFLPKIKPQEWEAYIVAGFRRTGKSIEAGQAKAICDAVDCHSWYVQQLSYFVWVATSDTVTDDIITQAIRQLVDTNMPMFMNDVEGLTPAQVNMLRAVASGEQHFNALEAVRTFSLGSAQTITRNKRILVERDFLDRQDGRMVFADPVFECWFRRDMM